MVGITDPASQVGLLSGLNMLGFAVVVGVGTFIEKLGRRPVWLWSIGLQTLNFAIFTALSVSLHLGERVVPGGPLNRQGAFEYTQNAAIGVATIPFIYFFFGFYVACWSTVAPMYATEILPTMLRSKGIGIYAFVQAITVTYNQYVNPIAIDAIQWKYYFLFLGLQVVLFLCAYFTFLETKVSFAHENETFTRHSG